LIGGARKVKDGLFPRKERCQYFGLKWETNTSFALFQALLTCLGTGLLRLITSKPELSANGNQQRQIPILDFQLKMNTIQ
jgi:hypothetical protein